MAIHYPTVTEELCGNDGLIVNVINGKTNRSTIHSDFRRCTDTEKIEKLIKRFVETGDDELSSFIGKFVKNHEMQLTGAVLKFFRGIKSSKEKSLFSDKIGPSPKPVVGRYNVEGEKCLYLTDNPAFLPSELQASSILLQRYEIPVTTLKIADLSSNNSCLHNSLALAFDMAENGRTSSGYNFEKVLKKSGKSEYLVSQLLSSLFKNEGWDGI